jgi:hypothetical protein
MKSSRSRALGPIGPSLVSHERRATVRCEDTAEGERRDVMRSALTDWRALLRQETGPSRRALRALVFNRLAFPAQQRDGERFYTVRG